jgi:hypothetical protein
MVDRLLHPASVTAASRIDPTDRQAGRPELLLDATVAELSIMNRWIIGWKRAK